MLDSMMKRYHKDKGIPAGLDYPAPGTPLAYSRHAKQKSVERFAPTANYMAAGMIALLPDRLPDVFDVFEVSTFCGVAQWWVVRFPLYDIQEGKSHRTPYDCVMALGCGLQNPLNVRTVYVNRKDDHHATLRVERYSRPEDR